MTRVIIMRAARRAAASGGDMQRELVERARSGDLEAFSDLARGSLTRLYAVATMILRDRHKADDAVQEALVHAWQHIAALRDPDAFDGWMHRITVRACYSAARKDQRRISIELPQAPDPETPGESDPGELFGDRERLEDAIARLPLDQRVVMVVHYYLDLPLPKTAELLDIPVGTAKSRLHHGLQALRRSMVREPEAGQQQARKGAA